MQLTDESRSVLLRALTDHRNTYRTGMRPTDVIAQITPERRRQRPSRIARWLHKMPDLKSIGGWRLRQIFR